MNELWALETEHLSPLWEYRGGLPYRGLGGKAEILFLSGDV